MLRKNVTQVTRNTLRAKREGGGRVVLGEVAPKVSKPSVQENGPTPLSDFGIGVCARLLSEVGHTANDTRRAESASLKTVAARCTFG